VFITIDSENYQIDDKDRVCTVSITDVPPAPVVLNGDGLPAWSVAVLVCLAVAVLAGGLTIIIILRRLKYRNYDPDGFSDPVSEEDLK